MNDVQLLSLPVVDFNIFVKTCQKVGLTPTKKLDEKSIPVGDLASFIGSVNLLFGSIDSTSAMRSTSGAGSYLTTIMFLILCDCEIHTQIINLGPELKTMTTFVNRDDRLMIVTGSVKGWVEFIQKSTKLEQHKELREIGNKIYNTLIKMPCGLSELLIDFSPKQLGDGTYEIKHK